MKATSVAFCQWCGKEFSEYRANGLPYSTCSTCRVKRAAKYKASQAEKATRDINTSESTSESSTQSQVKRRRLELQNVNRTLDNPVENEIDSTSIVTEPQPVLGHIRSSRSSPESHMNTSTSESLDMSGLTTFVCCSWFGVRRLVDALGDIEGVDFILRNNQHDMKNSQSLTAVPRRDSRDSFEYYRCFRNAVDLRIQNIEANNEVESLDTSSDHIQTLSVKSICRRHIYAVKYSAGNGDIVVTISDAHDVNCQSWVSQRKLHPALKCWAEGLLEMNVSISNILRYQSDPTMLPSSVAFPPMRNALALPLDRNPFIQTNLKFIDGRFTLTERKLLSMEFHLHARSQFHKEDRISTHHLILSLIRGVQPGDSRQAQLKIASDLDENQESQMLLDVNRQSSLFSENSSVLYYQQYSCHCSRTTTFVTKGGLGPDTVFSCSEESPQCTPFILVICMPWQRQVQWAAAAQPGPNGLVACCLDSTAQVNSLRWPLLGIVGQGPDGKGVPLAYAICSRETSETVSIFLKVLKQKIGFHPKQIVIDYSEVMRNAIATAFGSTTHVVLCTFHILQAIVRYCARTENRVPKDLRSQILNMIRSVQYASCHDTIQKRIDDIDKYLYEKGLEHMCRYLHQYYFKPSILPLWCLFYRPKNLRLVFPLQTNNLIERHWRLLKHTLMGSKINRRLDHLIDLLVDKVKDFFVVRKQIFRFVPLPASSNVVSQSNAANDRPPSSRVIHGVSLAAIEAVMGARRLKGAAIAHADPSLVTIIDDVKGIAQVKSSTKSSVLYHVHLEGPACECDDVSALCCKHIHAVAEILGRHRWPLEMFVLREAADWICDGPSACTSGNESSQAEPVPMEESRYFDSEMSEQCPIQFEEIEPVASEEIQAPLLEGTAFTQPNAQYLQRFVSLLDEMKADLLYGRSKKMGIILHESDSVNGQDGTHEQPSKEICQRELSSTLRAIVALVNAELHVNRTKLRTHSFTKGRRKPVAGRPQSGTVIRSRSRVRIRGWSQKVTDGAQKSLMWHPARSYKAKSRSGSRIGSR
eukprot:GILK01015027.1.p1 GENE.GILK01015027.1~~GILK01015027.1.p1  ORF type:complete len:1039 (-),score=30.33 GILK01015027.1:163-3279(-)